MRFANSVVWAMMPWADSNSIALSCGGDRKGMILVQLAEKKTVED